MEKLNGIDAAIVIITVTISLVIAFWVSRKATSSSKEYFLSGRNMPWWLLGVSMVATTFSADTPNFVTQIVRETGVYANWIWWAFLLTGMLTVFVYSKLWRRSEVLTDLEFYELRYSGKEAAYLRGFRAVYLGFVFNVIIMASILLAAIKIGGAMLQLSPIHSIAYVSVITVIFSAIGGLRGVILSDFLQFVIAMIGSIAAALYLVNLPEVGGLEALLQHPNVQVKTQIFPDFTNINTLIPFFILPLAIQWWSVWYPGAEPGGGSYVAQRMLASKNESNAFKATFLFNIFHYALRPWPWILVAFVSIVLFPDLTSLQTNLPHMDSSIIKDDVAYPLALKRLPPGLFGLVLASLIGALMSTLSTHLNWGASYISHDFYKRFINTKASDKQIVSAGIISTILLMVFAIMFALFLNSQHQAFKILLQIGAGTGAIFILRWFWWRINAYTEIAGMIASFIIAFYLEILHIDFFNCKPITWNIHLASQNYLIDWSSVKLLLGVTITSLAWIATTLLTKPTDAKVLWNFYSRIQPYNAGWNTFIHQYIQDHPNTTILQSKDDFPLQIVGMLLGTVLVFSSLTSIGYLLYGQIAPLLASLTILFLSMYFLYKIWHQLSSN